jgi:cytochrome c nitrite reductase small subunit
MRILVILLAVFLGLGLGVGAFTFGYARGHSYLTNDPAACANCHVMRGHYDAWLKSSHRAVAVCNDCHTPHTPLAKYVVKAENGFWHSFAFTTGWFPDTIQIRPRNRVVVEESCRSCHREIVLAIEGSHGLDNEAPCVSCHLSVGHLQ